MENNLEVAGLEATEKVLFATHYLSGPARAWWTSARAMNAGKMMTWEDFKLKVSKYHVPQGLIKKMRDEFRELKQGRMSVVEYAIPHSQAIQMEGKLHQANKNRKRRMMNQNGPSNAQKYRNNSSGGFTPRNNKSPAQTYRPNYTNNNGGPPKHGGNNNNNQNNNNHTNNNNHPNGNNNNNPNTAPRTGSNVVPINPKDKSTVNCYECRVVGHYSNECPKKLAKIAANTAAPAQQQRRFAAKRNPNNRNSRLYHMNATEAQEAPQAMPKRDVVTAARSCQSVHDDALDTTGHGSASPPQTFPPSLLLHEHPPRRKPAPRHGVLDGGALSPSSRTTTVRHRAQVHDDDDDAPVLHFQRPDARRVRLDVTNPTAPTPVTLAHCRRVDDDDLTRTLGHLAPL
ncbi:hypothetical protein QYE76_026032 [Lolium multiflorum]|uniref:CCHC-type domain-containing protein n=1 Tax=Lolium multiflorum TaxID=4521 RepID=A0AAD8RGQ2_LOLMU|nr:hypothetical protein QYE76_026032 [Lolium multiflorum]